MACTIKGIGLTVSRDHGTCNMAVGGDGHGPAA
jgi:hypothetical protein